MAAAKKLKPYTPTQKDLEFFRELIRVLNDQGVWHLPKTNQIYRIDKSKGTFTLTEPAYDANPMTMFTHHHNSYILKRLGWKCLPEVDWENL